MQWNTNKPILHALTILIQLLLEVFRSDFFFVWIYYIVETKYLRMNQVTLAEDSL